MPLYLRPPFGAPRTFGSLFVRQASRKAVGYLVSRVWPGSKCRRASNRTPLKFPLVPRFSFDHDCHIERSCAAEIQRQIKRISLAKGTFQTCYPEVFAPRRQSERPSGFEFDRFRPPNRSVLGLANAHFAPDRSCRSDKAYGLAAAVQNARIYRDAPASIDGLRRPYMADGEITEFITVRWRGYRAENEKQYRREPAQP